MRELLIITGTRADWGKWEPLVSALRRHDGFRVRVVATGQHLSLRWGQTVRELETYFGDDPWALYRIPNGAGLGTMSGQVADTVRGLDSLVGAPLEPDMILVHGDRPEAMAGAVVGAMRNVLVGHVEGGEVSGTVDESTRHAVSKYAHVHFVANAEAASRLARMGECASSVHVIGSPEVDVLTGELPSIDEVRARYEIGAERYGVLIYHPVTTLQPEHQHEQARAVFGGCTKSGLPFVVLAPNSDHGWEIVREHMDAMPGARILPSMRHKHFLALLKGAEVIAGNSSTGVREAPVLGVPAINVGSRQLGRTDAPSVYDCPAEVGAIEFAIRFLTRERTRFPPYFAFGRPGVADRFMGVMRSPATWATAVQKQWREAV